MSFTVSAIVLPLPPPVNFVYYVRFYDHVLFTGRKGETIQKMRSKYDININVPSASAAMNSEEANKIRLIGYEKNCHEAAEEIQQIIQELVSWRFHLVL